MASPSFLRNNKNNLFKLFGVLTAFAFVSGCDSSGDSIGPKPDITLSGKAVKGTIIGAPVNIYRVTTSSSTIPSNPNIEGAEDNVFTNSSGNFSVTLNGDSFRNRTLVVQVGVATCTTQRAEYDQAEGACRDTDGSRVEIDDPYYVGQYRCDDTNGCIHPETAETVAFGELLPIDFELRTVVPELSNSSSVRSQTANLSALTTLAANEIVNVGGGYSEDVARAVYDKIAKVFQLDGINILTHSMVDVSNLSSNVTNDNTWLLSAVNAGITATASRPEFGTPVTMGTGLRALNTLYLNNGGQLVYRYSGSDDQDLQSIFAMAQSITDHAEVSGFVSDTAKTQLDDLEASILNEPVDTLTEETASQSILDEISNKIASSKTLMFDFLDWYDQEVDPDTPAHDKFEKMLGAIQTGARESIGYMETLGNDFTLVLAAALDQILDPEWNGDDFTLNSTDSNNNPVTATLSKFGSTYTIDGQYLNTTFTNLTFTYRNDDASLSSSRPQDEQDDSAYRFDFQTQGSGVEVASNEGLILKFNENAAISLQVDGEFDGTEATVVRSAFNFSDINLAQKAENTDNFDQTVGRISIDGQFIFTMEHVADSITRFNSDYTGTETFNVPRVDNREFVFLQFGQYSTSSPTPTRFQITVNEVGSTDVLDTWPVSFLFAVLTQENVQNDFYGAEGFGSFDLDYLENVWGENDCDFLPATYSFLFDENTSDDFTYNDIDVQLPDSDGVERDFNYSLAYTKQKSQLQSATENEKDQSRLCKVTYSNGDDNSVDINFYKTTSVSETGSLRGSGSNENRTFNYINFGDLSNTHSFLFSETIGPDDALQTRSSTTTFDDCENLGSYSGVSGGGVGRLYNCNTPAAGSDDEYCLNQGLYHDLAANPIIGSRIIRQDDGNGGVEIVVAEENYQSCSQGEDWEIRYTDGTIQVLPVDLSVFGVPSN